MNHVAAHIGIGSNIGDRFANLQSAVELLDHLPGTMVMALSRVYMTEPVGEKEQERFFNAVVAIETTLDPAELRRHCKEIEQQLGRPERYARWSPRVIDLDILLYDDCCMQTELLTIPHSELHRRKFVLIPLLDIGNPVHPGFDMRISELVKSCDDRSVPIRLTEELVKN